MLFAMSVAGCLLFTLHTFFTYQVLKNNVMNGRN
jgi:hypothetical protein